MGSEGTLVSEHATTTTGPAAADEAVPPPSSSPSSSPAHAWPPFSQPPSPSAAPPSPSNRLAEHRARRVRQLADAAGLVPTGLWVAARLLDLCRADAGDVGPTGRPAFAHDETSALAATAELIAMDPALAAQALAMARPGAPSGSVAAQVRAAGRWPALAAALPRALAGMFNHLGLGGPLREGLYRAALLKAVACREVARKLCPARAEEAWLCGLMQDVALPTMHAADPSVWSEALSVLDLQDRFARESRENRLFARGHAAVGRDMLLAAGVAGIVPAAVAAHHDGVEALTAALGGDEGLARAVDAAAALPHVLLPRGEGGGGLGLQRLASRLAGVASLSRPAWVRLISAEYVTALSRLGADDAPPLAFKDLVADLCAGAADAVAAALAEMAGRIDALRADLDEAQRRERGALRQQREVAAAARQLAARARNAEYDGLTDALNRRAFLARGQELLALARRHDTPCLAGSVAIPDLRRLNAEHGYGAGDEALRLVGTRLVALVKGRGIVGRLGGAEFALLVAGVEGQPLRSDRWRARAQEALADLTCTPTLEAGRPVQVRTHIALVELGVPSPADEMEVVLRRLEDASET